MPARDRRHHTHPHFVHVGRNVRAAANRNPATRCITCGGTHAEGVARWGDRGAAWQAGHINDGEIGGPLGPEHAHCNASKGARAVNARRRGGYDWP